MSDDEEVQVCDICEEILLGGAALKEHMEEAHPKPKEEVKEDRKRSRSGSPVSGAEKKKKRSRSRSGSKEERRREEKKMKKHKHRDRSRSRERHREKEKHKKGSMDGFIVDEEEERKKRLKKLMREGMVNVDDDGGVTIGQERGKAFPSQGLVVTHDNLNGPQCPKCDQICKDNANLKNHVLSHYYQDFYRVTPDTKPYACPTCGKENRDRITMIRHFAFSHNMLYELTDMTPEMLNTTRGGGGLGPQGRGPVNKTPNKQDKRLANKSDSEDDDEKFRKRMAALANKNDKNSTEVKTTFGKHEHKHKKEKKEKKHKEHRDHKETEEERRIRKEKKRAEKEKEREKERRGSKEGSSNPLGSMMKEISPADSPQESFGAPPRRIAHAPPPRSATPSPEREAPPPPPPAEQEDGSDDDFGDLPAPVFAE